MPELGQSIDSPLPLILILISKERVAIATLCLRRLTHDDYDFWYAVYQFKYLRICNVHAVRWGSQEDLCQWYQLWPWICILQEGHAQGQDTEALVAGPLKFIEEFESTVYQVYLTYYLWLMTITLFRVLQFFRIQADMILESTTLISSINLTLNWNHWLEQLCSFMSIAGPSATTANDGLNQ